MHKSNPNLTPRILQKKISMNAMQFLIFNEDYLKRSKRFQAKKLTLKFDIWLKAI